jgi:hypothetical protein
MESNTNLSNMEKMNIAQVIILLLLGIDRIFKMFINSKCLKKMSCKFLGYNFINFEAEEQVKNNSPPQSPRNINKE